MPDTKTKDESQNAEKELASKTWDVLASIGIGMAVGFPILPPSVIKSLRKAVDRMIGGATDYLMSNFEASVTHKKIIEEGNRIVLTQAAQAAGHAAAQDQQLVQRAIRTFASELLVQQTNKEKTIAFAVDELALHKPAEDPGTIIDDDWLGTFATLAAQKSNEEVQRLLGKILAGEIRQPGSFSPLTLHILSTLTPKMAKLIEKLCNLSMTWGTPNELACFLCGAPFPEFLQEGLPQYELEYSDLLVLENYGLLLQLDARLNARKPIREAAFDIGGTRLHARTKTGRPIKFEISPIAAISPSGRELRKIIALEPHPDHLKATIEYLQGLGFNIEKG